MRWGGGLAQEHERERERQREQRRAAAEAAAAADAAYLARAAAHGHVAIINVPPPAVPHPAVAPPSAALAAAASSGGGVGGVSLGGGLGGVLGGSGTGGDADQRGRSEGFVGEQEEGEGAGVEMDVAQDVGVQFERHLEEQIAEAAGALDPPHRPVRARRSLRQMRQGFVCVAVVLLPEG